MRSWHDSALLQSSCSHVGLDSGASSTAQLRLTIHRCRCEYSSFCDYMHGSFGETRLRPSAHASSWPNSLLYATFPLSRLIFARIFSFLSFDEWKETLHRVSGGPLPRSHSHRGCLVQHANVRSDEFNYRVRTSQFCHSNINKKDVLVWITRFRNCSFFSATTVPEEVTKHVKFRAQVLKPRICMARPKISVVRAHS